MTPVQFIDGLLVHYAKRHKDETAGSLWMREMVAMVANIDSRVLARAYMLIRDTHDERAFPLPKPIKDAIARAAEQIYPEHDHAEPHSHPWSQRSLRAPDTPEVIATNREAREWQHAVIAKYGSWAGYEAAKRGLAEVLDIAPQDVSRPAFEAMQSRTRNRAHVDLGAITRRITGERE